MKRWIYCYSVLLVSIFCTWISASALAESAFSTLSEMSVEELLHLRDLIDVTLEEKGHSVYFDIERGTKGEDVSAIQVRLSSLGFYTGKISGKFDSETQKAFKAFEKTNNLQNDGLASRDDQIVLFGESVIAKAIPTPNPSAAPNTHNSNLAQNEHDVSFDYEHCLRYPGQHMGETYKLKGRVEQTIGGASEGRHIRFSVLGNTDEIMYVSINQDLDYNILEKDWLILDLKMLGTATYESVLGNEITIPYASAFNVVLR